MRCSELFYKYKLGVIFEDYPDFAKCYLDVFYSSKLIKRIYFFYFDCLLINKEDFDSYEEVGFDLELAKNACGGNSVYSVVTDEEIVFDWGVYYIKKNFLNINIGDSFVVTAVGYSDDKEYSYSKGFYIFDIDIGDGFAVDCDFSNLLNSILKVLGGS